jgi:hypothetical protein
VIREQFGTLPALNLRLLREAALCDLVGPDVGTARPSWIKSLALCAFLTAVRSLDALTEGAIRR